MECTMCKESPGLYDFKNNCCLVRYLLSSPVTHTFHNNAKFLELKYGNARMNRVMNQGKDQFEAKFGIIIKLSETREGEVKSLRL